MSDSGYKDFIRGVKGSNQEHLDDLQFKIKKDTERLEKITKKYQAKNGEIDALDEISFSQMEGEFVSIIGPSGCGKSTLLSVIAGLEDKTSR